ncbi:MAG: PqqD family protein [Acidobacteria bacterium]|nr:PqqD family protein [Acidobacteriota bacterium]MBI3426789.1 PqqD family protein [Acidobacteriota bacterium]
MPTTTLTSQLPRARREGLLFSPLNDELVIYDTERNKAHSLNRIATLVWKNCDGKTTVSQLRGLIAQELHTEVDEQVVWLALQQLERNRLLEGRVQSPGNLITRREAAKRFGKVAGIVLPLVASALVPPAAAAGSLCGGTGALCFANSDCCSNSCNLVTNQCNA